MKRAASISRHLSWCLALLTLVGLGAASTVIYCATAMRLNDAQEDMLRDKARLLSELVRASSVKGEEEVRRKLDFFQPVRGGTRLMLYRADGSPMFTDGQPAFAHARATHFEVAAPSIAGGTVRGDFSIDTAHDVRMLHGLAITLVLTTLGGAALSGGVILWLVRRELRPLKTLASQTRGISVERLDQRLELERPAEELAPWIAQFNALMDRLERAYAQLEGFNADVAHELRTPLATLIGQTELALSRERPVESLRETLVSNLEEMQRLSALVNDMLFLSHADRGAVARRGHPVSLAALARQVVDFHEAALDEAALQLRVEGDAQVAVDEPLFKRAVSNLLGNATRFAERGSTIVLRIAPELPERVQVMVQNAGPTIEPQFLPRLFDRFFRADASRGGDAQTHHGLGLAIVAAIARMHAGQTLAESAGGVTRVGFTLARR